VLPPLVGSTEPPDVSGAAAVDPGDVVVDGWNKKHPEQSEATSSDTGRRTDITETTAGPRACCSTALDPLG